MDKNIIIAVVLAALVLVAAVQAVQLFNLRSKISNGQVAVQSPVGGTGGSSPTLPSGLENLPSMVGGC